MKLNNICYVPVNDCGGFGGNWFWNTKPVLPQMGGNGFGMCLGTQPSSTKKYFLKWCCK